VLEEMGVVHDEGFSGRVMAAIDADGDGVLGKCCRCGREDGRAEELARDGAGGAAAAGGGAGGAEQEEPVVVVVASVVVVALKLNYSRMIKRGKLKLLSRAGGAGLLL